MTKAEFTELAYNNPRDALLSLWDRLDRLQAEQDATQATVVELAAEVNAAQTA
jgi:hypothetical protein